MKRFPFEYAPIIIMLSLLVAHKQFRDSEAKNSKIEYINKASPLNIGLYTFIGYGPLFVAKEKGFFDSLNLAVNLHKIEGDPERRAALASGRIDVATHTLDALVSLRANGLDAKAFLLLDSSLGADGIIANNEIRNVADLKNKSVAFASGTPSHFFLQSILSEAGLSTKDIKARITDTPDKAAQAFISGEVNAAVSWEPWITNATRSSGHILIGSEMRPFLIKDVMYANTDSFINKKRELQVLTNVWFLTINWMNENPTEAKKIIGKKFGISDLDMDLIFPKVQYHDKAANRRAFTYGSNLQSLYGLYNSISDVWLTEGIISQPDSAKLGLYPNFFR